MYLGNGVINEYRGKYKPLVTAVWHVYFNCTTWRYKKSGFAYPI